MLLCATTVVLLAAAAGPRLGEVGASLQAGASREVGSTDVSVPSFSTHTFLGVEVSRTLDLELAYTLSKREGRGVTHLGGLSGYLYPSRLVELGFSLFGSPPGRSDEGVYCLPLGERVRCVDAVEQVGFLSPAVDVGLTTSPRRNVVGLLEAGVEATFYRLDYHVLSGRAAGTRRHFPFQEYRLKLEGAVRLYRRVEVGAHGAYGLFFGAQRPGAQRATSLPPTELPLAPTRFELGPQLTLHLLPALRAELSADYGPYIYRCFGHSLYGSLRLTTQQGRLRLFAQVTHQRDVSPTDEATLEACELDEPVPDYASTSARMGFRVTF